MINDYISPHSLFAIDRSCFDITRNIFLLLVLYSGANCPDIKILQEMNFAKEQIQSSDALMDLSMGLWEGCSLSDIYT